MRQLTRPSPYALTLSAAPSVKIAYDLPADWQTRPYALLHTQTQDGTDHDDAANYQDAWAYVDGMGRTILTLAEADPSQAGGDGGKWIANGLTEYDNKGAERRKFLAWFTNDDPGVFSLAQVPPTYYGRQRYDAFGRQLETYNLDGSVSLKSVYHALSVDKWDAADLSPGPHAGTYASAATDGHGRTITRHRARARGADG